MGIVMILNQEYRKYLHVDREVKDLEDFSTAKLTPQQMTEGKGLEAELSLAIANRYDFLFIIHLAMNEAGQYFFGYDIVSGNKYDGSLPKFHFNDNPKTETLVRCILYALDYCSYDVMRRCSSVRMKVSWAAKDAVRRINDCRLKQMTIFDMM